MDRTLQGRRIGWEERDRIAAAHRALLTQELTDRRLELASRPSRAHVQFSTFCNMSCVMCWDGRNPPLKKMEGPVLERLARQVAPGLSVITPHDGNEPLLVSWEETRRLAEEYSVRLALTTNGQFLDEEAFLRAKDVLEHVTLSIDSHVPEIYAKIRTGGKPAAVFENLDRVVALSEEHRVECIVQAVFMTENAAMMPQTVAFMAAHGVQTVNVIAMVDANGHSGHLDPTLHFSAEWIEGVRQRCIGAAQAGGIRLGWQLAGAEWHDFRPPGRATGPHPGKVRDREADHRLALLAPGFCRHAREGVRVTASGEVTPCPMATGGELQLGTLATQDFDEIWNGACAQDLRRAHYTWDYPTLCETCRFTDPVGPQAGLAFVDHVAARLGARPQDVAPVLRGEAPEHMARLERAPVVTVAGADPEAAGYVLALALGGEAGRVELCEPPAVRRSGRVELHLPESIWTRLSGNLGWWWTVFELGPDGAPTGRTATSLCMIRHEPIPRIAGSTLTYPDDGRPAELYLGGERQIGWTVPGRPAARPAVRRKRDVPRRRFKHGLPERLRAAVTQVVPEDADVLVVSKGYEPLLRLGARRARHFPSAPDGSWAGYHPRDDAAAIAHLESQHAGGATHLVIPAWSRWWLEHYSGFAAHLETGHRRLADVPGAGVIFELLASRDSDRDLVAAADRLLGEAGQHRRFWQRFHPGAEAADALPRFAVAADGYELTDSRGRTYVDWVCGGGPVLLGYRHPQVEEAIRAQLDAGPTLSLPHPVQVEVAALLTELIPCAEMVAFGKNGSDAVTAAVRLARAATGREVILQYGVHGFHDWSVSARPAVQGVPRALRELIEPFPYNDLPALEELLERFRGEVAAVLMEPVAGAAPQAGYLEGVRKLAHRYGALLIFDEMVTGFRLAAGGAQQLYGVEPDLACFGKALSNGMPLSAVAGPRRHMERLPQIAFGMTFRGETLSLAAARAVLRIVRDEPVAEHIAAIGERLRAAFADACARHGVHGELRGPAARLFFFFADHGVVGGAALRAAFLHECIAQGVFTNGNFLPTYAHDDAAIERTERAFDAALAALARQVERGSAAVARYVARGGGTHGYIDVVRERDAMLDVQGWLLAGGAAPEAVELVSDGGAVTAARPLERPDVAARFPDAPGAGHAGFAALLPADGYARDGEYRFTVRALRAGAVVFSGRIVRSAPGDQAAPVCGDDGVLRL